MGRAPSGPLYCRVRRLGALCPHLGASGDPARSPDPCGRGRISILGKIGKLRLPRGSDLSWVTQQTQSQLNSPRCLGVPGRPHPAYSYSPAPPPEPERNEEWALGSPTRRGPRGGATLAPPRPYWLRRQGRGAAARCWGGARRRARVPLAGRPSPLRAAPAGVRRTGRPGGGSGSGMHSARLDSFLGQLRWELVRLGSGCGL